ncbi:hypothetical protein VHEMI00940 [[Torrubiella] hemipterigena]|uniref:Major facilitator superfamily (MFS) profile domain-containing protein n=1 Tax=[Torrubiella] hemipterigena TaxID=1531966 RepID=A0A0A1T610_9HYPO|nr:hypothetical protein VHEMI00940 [[Torrubiella] hemipterigena]
MARKLKPSEQTPLLREQHEENGVAANHQQSEQTTHAGDDEETTVIGEELPMVRLAMIMVTAWVGVFLGAVDSTIIATLSGPISSEFNSLGLMSWLASAYFIANAACQPISGRLTDIFGRGPGLVFSNVFFALGNYLCGVATDQRTMIFGRVIAGIGGGGLMSISTFIGSDLIPLRKRGIVQGMGNLFYSGGAMLGGIFGGYINDHTKTGWRLAFLIQVPLVLLSAVAAFFLIRVPPKQSNKSYLARIDFAGVFLTVSFLVLLLVGINSGGESVNWLSPIPLTTIPLSFVAFGAFLWWESKARQPIIPVKLLAQRTVLAACLANFLTTMVIMMGLFYVPLFLQVRGATPTTAGLYLLPSPFGASLGSILSGFVMKRTGRYWAAGVTCLCLFVAGTIVYISQSLTSPMWVASVGFFLVGGGYGGMLTITLLACIAAVDHSQQAVVTSGTYLARSLGSSIGVTIGGAVYQNVLRLRLWSRFGDEPRAEKIIEHILKSLDSLKDLPPGWKDGVMASYMDAFRALFLTGSTIAVLGLLSISMMKEHKLHSTLSRTEE